jgi:uncharacterized protein (TIGR02996 family)
MNEEDAFLQAVIADPEDDAPRLVYADWLEERGDVRGEFIRAQCALAQRGFRADLADRAADLLEEHQEQWAGAVRVLVLSCEFRRGFIEGVTATGDQFLDGAKELFRLAPVRQAHLLGVVPYLAALCESPYLARLTGLDLRDSGIGNRGAGLLARSPHLAGLTTLDLRRNGIDAEGVSALAESPHLAGLTLLDLSGNPVGAAGLRAVASSPYLGRRAPLSVRYDPVGGLERDMLAARFGRRLEFR